MIDLRRPAEDDFLPYLEVQSRLPDGANTIQLFLFYSLHPPNPSAFLASRSYALLRTDGDQNWLMDEPCALGTLSDNRSNHLFIRSTLDDENQDALFCPKYFIFLVSFWENDRGTFFPKYCIFSFIFWKRTGVHLVPNILFFFLLVF